MGQRASNFRRAKASRPPLKRFLIVCEGERSEPSYIAGIRALCRPQLISIKVVTGAGQTKKVVEEAIRLKKEAKSRAKQLRDPFEEFDSVWCVIDVDNHLLLKEALVQARDNHLSVALSNPCYEVWVILHHRDHRKSTPRDALQRECKSEYAESDKHVGFSKLWPLYEGAKARAQSLRKWQLEMERCYGDPWTNFDELTEELLTLKRI